MHTYDSGAPRRILPEYYRNLPIIALTANTANNAKEMFLLEGMNDFVGKPIEMMDITAKIQKWLPPEKIKSLLSSTRESEKKIYKDIIEIEGLDVKAGIALSGTMELYKKVLSDYASVIKKKANLIEKYFHQKDISAYTIEVYALKSASKLIGVTELSEMSSVLETCGNQGDWKTIEEKTEELLEKYRT